MSSSFVRFSGLVAMLGGMLGIALTPILSYLEATYSDTTYLYYGRGVFPSLSGMSTWSNGAVRTTHKEPIEG